MIQMSARQEVRFVHKGQTLEMQPDLGANSSKASRTATSGLCSDRTGVWGFLTDP